MAHEHHPYCHVVIDNRPGHQLMAVVKNSAFDNKPDKVCGILYQAFNNAAILGQYHLKLEFSRYQRDKNEFWPVVNDIRSKFKDSVRQIRMDFKGKEEDEEISLSFEICDVVYDKETRKESYNPIELTYLIPFLNSFEKQ